MKVILNTNVAGLGNAGEVKSVADGYARNYLLPRKFAFLATDVNIKDAQERIAKQEQEKEKALQELGANIKKLDGETIVIPAKASESGSLFAGIDEKTISIAISQKKNIAIDPKYIKLDTHIKNIGKHPVVLVGTKKEQATLMLDVVPVKEDKTERKS